MRIGIIGCGHMGSALARAALEKKLGDVWISNPHPKKIPGAHYTGDNALAVQKTELIVLGVRPGSIESVIKEIQPELTADKILISIAAGITLKKLVRWSKNHKKIVRVLPNLPAQVGLGLSVWKSCGVFSKSEKKQVKEFLEAFVISMEVKNEKLIDKAIASGCGPAFTAEFLERLAQFAKEAGYSKNQARDIALQTVYGSAVYIKKTGIPFADLVRSVQTKGGVTEAAFKTLNKKKWGDILLQACRSGYERTKKLIS